MNGLYETLLALGAVVALVFIQDRVGRTHQASMAGHSPAWSPPLMGRRNIAFSVSGRLAAFGIQLRREAAGRLTMGPWVRPVHRTIRPAPTLIDGRDLCVRHDRRTVRSRPRRRRGRTYGHARARGSFTTRDPLDGVAGTPTVANPYHYADNDPVNKVDPTGMRPRDSDLCVDSPFEIGFVSGGPPGMGFDHDRAKNVLRWRDRIDLWSRLNGINSLLLAATIYHEGGNYLAPARRSLTQARDYAEVVADINGVHPGMASVGATQAQLRTAQDVLSSVYCESGYSDFKIGAALIESDDFALSIAAGVLSELKSEFPTAPDRGLFIAYAFTAESARFMDQAGWNLQKIAQDRAANLYIGGHSYRGTGLSTQALTNALARETYWNSAVAALRRAGW